MSITFNHTGKKGGMLRRVLLIAAIGVISLAGVSIWQAYRLRVATAADRQRRPVQGVVTAPVVGEYDVDPKTATFVFRGSVNMSAVEGWIAIDVLKDPSADPNNEQNWAYDRGFAEITGSGLDFTFESAPLQLFNLEGLTPWVDGGLGRARVAFVFRDDRSWELLRVQDSDGITPENEHVLVFADINPDRTDQRPSGSRCVPQDLDNVQDPTNPCTPDYLSANRRVSFSPPGQKDEQEQAAIGYYQQVKTAPDGTGESIEAALSTLQKFRERYFAPFECDEGFNEPEAVTTYFNHGDLGIGREMHCIRNGCIGKQELACYVMNFVGGSDGTPFFVESNATPLFGDKAGAQAAVEQRKPFATVAMVDRQHIIGSPNGVFFVVYEHIGGALNNTRLATAAQLDRKAFNTSIPGNCLQCHGINSTYIAHPDEVRGATFLPFDLDSFEFFSDDPGSALSRVRQEAAFRAQNRMVHSTIPSARLPDARELIAGWYGGDLFSGIFNGKFVPRGWSGIDQPYPPASPQVQLYRKVYARACRTCHISYEPESGGLQLQFGTYQDFLTSFTQIIVRACGSIEESEWGDAALGGSLSMPNAEQTLRVFWTTAARAHLFAQVPNAQVPNGRGDCALPSSHP
jgi:hypothetical protein